jgi:hypothetical protein
MEEISHIFLRHSPSGMRHLGGGLSLRDYNLAQEQEAYGVGAAALVPWASLFRDLNSGVSIGAIALKHEVSQQLIDYRVKITGAHNLHKARLRAKILRRTG